jgi:hypothetical protein
MGLKPRPVRVVWLDHFYSSAGEWVDLDSFPAQKPCVVVSYGFLIRKTKTTLLVAQTLAGGNQGNGLLVVLRSCVTKLEYL